MFHRVSTFAFFLLCAPTHAGAATCVGDCDADGFVTVDEVVRGVSLALTSVDHAGCAALDGNDDARVSVDELVTAVQHALHGCPPPPPWRFREVSATAGLTYRHGYYGIKVFPGEAGTHMGGVAAGDYDRDGWIDLYVVGGEIGPNRLFRNHGNGTFTEMDAGVAVTGTRGSGPTFADIDGDGWLDLFIGGVEGTPPQVFRNGQQGRFVEHAGAVGIPAGDNTFSAAFGDYDRDGDLDLCTAHWGTVVARGAVIEHLWRNRGDGTFEPVTVEAGLGALMVPLDAETEISWTFTPNFADVDSDGWLDLLIAADFGTSRIFHNQRNGTFRDVTDRVISDENGMGAAVGDYDNDGHLDWFISSIYDPDGRAEANWGVSGNRLYRNRGDGIFEDVTDRGGVRQGFWGWASCFADFNNDGALDLYHVNGAGYLDDVPAGRYVEEAREFHFDPARLFVGRGDGTFVERAAELGADDPGQGRGVACFDYDRDGDVDIFVANNGQPPRLLRNDGGNAAGFLHVTLRGRAPNSEAIGARIFATAGGVTQMRELRAGSNFVSQDPAVAYFGLGMAERVDELRVVWPDQTVTVYRDVPGRQRLVLEQSAGS
jgi:hypothetical protein